MGVHDYKDDLRTAYDADVERRDAMTPAEWRLDIIDRFADGIRSDGAHEVLELGCGTGQLARRLADQDFDVTAVDLSPANVEATRVRGVNAQVADFASLPFPDGAFDAAFGINSLLHVPAADLSAVLTEIGRVLRPGALLLIVVWGGVTQEGPMDEEWLHPPRFFSTYADDDLLALATPSFTRRAFDTIDVSEGDHQLHSQILTLEAI